MFTETVGGIDEGLSRLLEAARSGELPVSRLKDLIVASRSWEAKVAALQTDSARLIALREGHGDGGGSVLRDQAGKSKFQARRSLGAAEALDEMPGLRSAVDAGEVPLANAERLADAAKLTNPEAVDSASDLLAMAKELPPDRFAREVGVWTQRHQIDHGHGDYLQKRRRRYLRTWKQQDGMGAHGRPARPRDWHSHLQPPPRHRRRTPPPRPTISPHQPRLKRRRRPRRWQPGR